MAINSNKIGWTQREAVCGCGCGTRLTFINSQERKEINGRRVADDCYWKQFGDVVDAQPAVYPGMQRGK
ncbi:MAG: hypothetical protein RLZZ234_592, partial [Candidatus Parcubacteria bacterium]